MDRIDRFRIFTRVVECASFTRAADQLGLPRSTVSAAIAELEQRLGTRRLQRSTRRVSTTHDGDVFHARCLRLIAEGEDAESLFRQDDAQPVGLLKIDVPSRIGRRILAPALPDFFARYPQVELDLGMTDRAVNLIEDGCDAVLRVGQLSDSRLVARTLGQLDFVNVAAPAYLREHGVPQHPADLQQHRAVNYASPTTARVEALGAGEQRRGVDCLLRGWARAAADSALRRAGRTAIRCIGGSAAAARRASAAGNPAAAAPAAPRTPRAGLHRVVAAIAAHRTAAAVDPRHAWMLL
ncbi:hypothetical protein G6F50_013651 [Rhizopus delemar]|uniref:HTH lysR-type domain-containing protein n=1 Tax=Rhizopus delemar TaxID=936053 RepID=A0A9P7CCT8_9FUNG|nr:hypothetical protein G6F50_013651 [Rhizopus delemar]